MSERYHRDRKPIIGAAVGTGLAARGAVRGGCDFLLALSVAKLRSMGGTSMSPFLPLRDSNALVMDFGTSEILTARGDVPVFFGACSFDPRIDLGQLIDAIADAGFQGVVNFPTSSSYSREFCQVLDAAGVGYSRELEMLQMAKARGLRTLAYASDLDESLSAARAGADMINLSLGWHVRGFLNVRPTLDTLEAADLARVVFREVHRAHPDILLLVDGGPIVSPDDMFSICAVSRSDGYIGGSTIDSVPLEAAVEESVSAFKTFGALRRSRDAHEQSPLLRRQDRSIVGWSGAMANVRAETSRLARSGGAVLVTGPSGSGKELVARTLAIKAGCKSFVPVPWEPCAEESLFGTASQQHVRLRLGLLEEDGIALYIEDMTQIPLATQQRFLSALETGKFLRLGDNRTQPIRARIVFAASQAGSLLAEASLVYRPLVHHLAGAEIKVPALSERMEDMPLLLRHFLDEIGSEEQPVRVARSLYAELMAYHWPGNLRELRSVLADAVVNAAGQPLEPEHLSLLQPPSSGSGEDERQWILKSLQRHRFRRGDTAKFLGISRKTLYNKMRKFHIATGTKEQE